MSEFHFETSFLITMKVRLLFSLVVKIELSIFRVLLEPSPNCLIGT